MNENKIQTNELKDDMMKPRYKVYGSHTWYKRMSPIYKIMRPFNRY